MQLTLVEGIMDQKQMDDARFEELLIAAGLVKKEKIGMTPEQKLEWTKEKLALLEQVKERKDGRAAKKIRRQLRNQGVFISKLKKIELPQ